MKHIISYFIYTFLMVVCLFSCRTERADDCLQDNERYISVHVQVGHRDTPKTRSLASLRTETESGEDARNENRINSYTLFIFDQLGKCLSKLSDATVGSVSGKADKYYIFKLSYEEYRKYNGGTYMLVMVANYDFAGKSIKTKQDLDNIELSEDSFGTKEKQDNFVLRGECTGKIDFTSVKKVIIPVPVKLSRLAAKIRCKYPIFPDGFSLIDVNGKKYEVVDDDEHPIYVHLLGSMSKTRLGIDGFYEPDDYQGYFSAISSLMDKPKRVTSSDPVIFYSYPYRWGEEIKLKYKPRNPLALTIYYSICIRPKGTSDKPTRRYLPLDFSNVTGDEPGKKFDMLQSNMLYDIQPTIERTPPVEPTIFKMRGNLKITDWRVDNLTYNIENIHYFVAKEHNVVMSNRDSYSIDFVATRRVRVKQIGEVYYYYYTSYKDANTGITYGKIEKKVLNATEPGYPTITVDNDKKKIMISECELLHNYVPKYFSLELEDEGGLTEEIGFIQYPPIYVTGSPSPNDKLYPGVFYSSQTIATKQANFNIYRITAKASDEYYLGDPSYVDENGIVRTKTDEKSNMLISPDFVIASQRGIYNSMVFYDEFRYWTNEYTDNNPEMYNSSIKMARSALDRCATYGEAGYPPGTWRLPTLAELRLIDRMQDDPSSAVKDLLKGEKYWSAQKYAFYLFTTRTDEKQDPYDNEGVQICNNPMYQIVNLSSSYRNITHLYYNGYYYVSPDFPSAPKYNSGGYPFKRYWMEQTAGVRCVHDVY